MKLWLISQDENPGYYTYDSAVVAAETEDAARNVRPDGSDWSENCDAWASSPKKVSVRRIGTAVGCRSGEVICASLNVVWD